MTLAEAGVGRRVRIASIDLGREDAAWLAAIGIDGGEEVTVLRRAVLGGPLHVRTASGGEFAIDRDVARKIEVSAEAEEANS